MKIHLKNVINIQNKSINNNVSSNERNNSIQKLVSNKNIEQKNISN